MESVKDAVKHFMTTEPRFARRETAMAQQGRWKLAHLVAARLGATVSPETVARRHRELLKEAESYA